MKQSTILLMLLLALSLIPTSSQAHSPNLHLRCTWTIDRDFCTNISQAHQRLRDNYFTKWWSTWADEHEVLVEEQPQWANDPYKSWGAWPFNKTIGVKTGITTGDVYDSLALLHEITHIADGPQCTIEPWSHERVLFWHMLGAYALGMPTEYVWSLYTLQSGFEIRARLFPYSRTEPCREQGVPEVAPWGISYTELRGILPWWD